MIFSTAPSWAAVEDRHEHELLTENPGLRVDQVIEMTLLRHPEYQAAEVRDEQVQAYERLGDSWLAGQPSVQVLLYEDSLLGDIGEREFEYGLQVPLRWPGQRRDAERVGSTVEQENRQWLSGLRLEAAGNVRQLLAELYRAERMLDGARVMEEYTSQLFRVTETLFDAGEVPEVALLHAQTLVLEQEQQILDAEVALVDASRRYRSETGLSQKPVLPLREVLSQRHEISEQHPELAFHRARIDLARASVDQVKSDSRGSPTLSFGTRSQRGDRLTESNDALMLGLSVPFGGGSYTSARVADARRDQVDAEIQYLNAQRQLELQLHEAEHELLITRQSLALAGQQRDLALRRRDMALAAFEFGEISMADVIIAMQEAQKMLVAHISLEVRELQLTSEINQIIGVLP